MSLKHILAAAVLAAAVPAAAEAGVSISGAWTRPAAAGQNGAGYLTIVNTGRRPVTLRGASSPAAARASLHQSVMTGAIMSMRTLHGGLVIAPGRSVAFRPGSYHLMLEGLKRALKPGERAPVDLDFQPGGRTRVMLVVGSGPADARGAPESPDTHGGMRMR